MSEMIERVAIVLRDNSLGGRWDDPNWEIMARAAIAAMREPPPRLRIEAWGRHSADYGDTLADWQAMIGAALAEKAPE